MFKDLLLAAALTLGMGLSFALVANAVGREPSTSVAYLGLIVSVLLGVGLLARRQRERLVPLAAIYIVIMTAVLMYLEFLFAWRRGFVEM